MTHHFTCTLLSRVVLSARAATEGQVDSLDYLPGAKFLGIVAKGYESFSDQARHDLFHNGRVRFGNAYPFVGALHFYPAPFVYFAEKGKKITDSPVYLDHLMSQEAKGVLSKEGTQTKQVRKGYVDAAGAQYLNIDTDYQLKSAYDADKRRSKDSQMYGYFSIPRGITFAFSVEDTTGEYGDAITKALAGEHGVGRSRTAEYGRVRIEPVQAPESPTAQPTQKDNLTSVYALSDLCFYDAFGQPKLPEAKDLGFEGASIEWARTQVQSGEYQSWNSKRWNRNTDRWVIKKGSVFQVEGAAVATDGPMHWVGSYQQEGFGQIWINPPFLRAYQGLHQRPALHQASSENFNKVHGGSAPASANRDLISLLNRRAKLRNQESNLYQRVNSVIAEEDQTFRGISSSQWGTLRNYAKHAANTTALDQLVFSKKSGFLHRGQSEKKWRNARDVLQSVVSRLPENDQPLFLQKLAAEMAKRTKNQLA